MDNADGEIPTVPDSLHDFHRMVQRDDAVGNLDALTSEMVIQCDIEKCARCNGSHDQIRFVPFGLQSDDPNAYTHFAICPSSQEPLVIKVRPHGTG